MKIRRLSDSEFSATIVEPVTEPMSVVQNVFSLVMLSSLLVFLLFWAMLWAGLAIERMMLLSMGVAGTATGLLFVGEALMPRWQRVWWKPPRVAGRPYGLAGCRRSVPVSGSVRAGWPFSGTAG